MLKHNSRVGAVVRSFGLGVLALAVLVGLTVSAQQQQQPAQPVTQIKIVPEKPTTNDEITIELAGTFPDFCAPDSAEAQVELNQVTIRASNVSQFCAEGETKWSLSVPVGKKLEAGPYRVLVLFGMSKDAEEPELLLGMASFDVVAAAQSRSADQAGQAGLVPFTILPVVQTLVGSVPFVGGALAANNLNSSKSNLNRQIQPIPTTVGVPIGDVVSISNLNSSKSNLYRVVGFRVRGGLVIGKESTDRLMIEITEPDPILTVLVEQTELPDLAVRIRATVRRYTEREQVFCDVTVTTTVSNLGKGPTGVVALASNLNSSKPNLQRYGLGSGKSATQAGILLRLRPGSYPLEAEVESRSVKESNTANNKAREVVICQ